MRVVAASALGAAAAAAFGFDRTAFFLWLFSTVLALSELIAVSRSP